MARKAWQLKNSKLIEGGVPVQGFTQIEYSVEQAKTNNYGANGKVYSMSEGNEEFSGTIDYYSSEIADLCRSGQVSTLNQLPPQDMQWLMMDVGGVLATHTFKNRRYTSHGGSFNNEGEDSKMSVGFTFTELVITY